jgi:2-hydroxy-6-oxonona-2,4-dienedioate hydrolase
VFQVAEYAKHFTCFSVDLRGAGLSGQPEGSYTTELFADDIAGFMQAADIGTAHIAGLSLGAAAGMWLAAKHPAQVKSLSLHSAWPSTDPFLRAVVQTWPELYAVRPEYIESLAEFVRGRPMPPVDAFLRQSGAVLSHDASGVLGSVQAPTLITFGRHDQVTSTRFAGPLTDAIAGSELVVFEDCSHAPIYENVDEFNQRTLAFLQRHSG